MNPELAHCDLCGGRIIDENHIKDHAECDRSKCAYCRKSLNTEYLKTYRKVSCISQIFDNRKF